MIDINSVNDTVILGMIRDAQAKHIEELKVELAYWQKDSADAWDKCEDNRVKLAKAVGALERIASNEFAGRVLTSLPPKDAAAYFARSTLAELTGGKDE